MADRTERIPVDRMVQSAVERLMALAEKEGGMDAAFKRIISVGESLRATRTNLVGSDAIALDVWLKAGTIGIELIRHIRSPATGA